MIITIPFKDDRVFRARVGDEIVTVYFSRGKAEVEDGVGKSLCSRYENITEYQTRRSKIVAESEEDTNDNAETE